MRYIPMIDLIYPRRCPVCQNIVKPNKENLLICPDCKMKLPYIQEPRCMKCGKEIERKEQEYCSDCIRIPKHYVKGYPVFHYVEPVKKGVAAFKYHNRREYSEFYCETILEQFGENFRELHLDGILPVPIHRHKLRVRGYNQAELLSRRLSRILQVPHYKDLLVRRIDTTPQKELNDKERLNNLKRAFFLRQNEVKLKRVLLVDDIYTTGATIEACTEVLLQSGVQAVYYTAICIGKGFI